MRTISTLQLDALLQNSTPIESDGFGLKVARLSDGNFLKFYRRKRLLSSALWILPSERLKGVENGFEVTHRMSARRRPGSDDS